MNISVVGSGYVGITTGIGFAELGNRIIFVDVDRSKVDLINSKVPPIFENGLKELMEKNADRYSATESYVEAVINSEITFICVGTPSSPDGSIDLHQVKQCARSLGEALAEKDEFHVVSVKSTVVPGTTEEVIIPILEKYSNKRVFEDFGVAVTPEFLREGEALSDFFNPDRVVIGSKDNITKNLLSELHSPFDCPKLFVDLKTAEMIKYASNAFLATKISFANEIGNICKKLGIDTYKVLEGVGLDHRINPSFFRAGLGFGGSCFPKDIRALIAKAEELGCVPKLLKSVLEVNDGQPLKMIDLLKKHINDLRNKKIGILGLAFKPETDDVRESRAIILVKRLLEEGAEVIAYDPIAIKKFHEFFPNIKYASTAQEAVNEADAVLIVTEWREFENLDYNEKIVIDGRRLLKVKEKAKIYEGLCW
jgi:UDPglucose 6-dehydrogenase